MRTLIVDDEPIARRVLREELELCPEVLVIGEAADGKEALQKIEQLKPDVVFLDLQMPVMSGFEVVRSLSGHWQACREAAQRAGITKPVRPHLECAGLAAVTSVRSLA